MLEQYYAYLRCLIIFNIKRNDMIYETVWGIRRTRNLVIGLKFEYFNNF
jgi:hypothetical protein